MVSSEAADPAEPRAVKQVSKSDAKDHEVHIKLHKVIKMRFARIAAAGTAGLSVHCGGRFDEPQVERSNAGRALGRGGGGTFVRQVGAAGAGSETSRSRGGGGGGGGGGLDLLNMRRELRANFSMLLASLVKRRAGSGVMSGSMARCSHHAAVNSATTMSWASMASAASAGLMATNASIAAAWRAARFAGVSGMGLGRASRNVVTVLSSTHSGRWGRRLVMSCMGHLPRGSRRVGDMEVR